MLNGQVFAQITAGQFKKYTEQYGRFSIQVPKDWTIGSPTIKQDSVAIDSEPNNGDDISFIVSTVDKHSYTSEYDWEQVVREEYAATISDSPGATLIQDTECATYVIDGNKACSMIYTSTYQYTYKLHTYTHTNKELDISFHTARPEVLVTFAGSTFDKYLPVAQQMLNSMKVS